MRRHRITGVHISKKHPGFRITTINGDIYFSLKDTCVLQKLKKHFPHKYEEITKENYIDEEILQDLLIGKYIYGTSVEQCINNYLHKVLT